MAGRAATLAGTVPVRGAYADGRDGQIHYRIARPTDGEAGGAPPLVCLHASPLSGWLYKDLLAEMGRDRIALAPDTPGFGASAAPAEPPEIADYAEAMAMLVEGLQADGTLPAGPVDLLGYHTGSMTAAVLARSRSDLVRRVAMISLPVFTDEELATLKAHYTHPRAPHRDGSHLTRSFDFLASWMDETVDLDWVQACYAETLRGGALSHWGHRAAFNCDLRQVLPQVDQPILVLNPQDDLWAQTKSGAGLIRNGRVHDLPGWNHGFLTGRTAEAASLLRDFLDG